VHTRGSISFGQHLKKMVFIFSFFSNIYNSLIILVDIISASIIYINILINFDIHLDFDSIDSIELHNILQETKRNGSVYMVNYTTKIIKEKIVNMSPINQKISW